mmetsp:Transcript_82948/g.232469  ORF Transcript_82948/g.232469 Transcript_82948/m.232469 type:complete len:128 (+) Transcript_82948:424-807(+)
MCPSDPGLHNPSGSSTDLAISFKPPDEADTTDVVTTAELLATTAHEEESHDVQGDTASEPSRSDSLVSNGKKRTSSSRGHRLPDLDAPDERLLPESSMAPHTTCHESIPKPATTSDDWEGRRNINTP